MLPYLVLGGFCGLRTAQIMRIRWRDVRPDEGAVVVEAASAKTGSRRLAPLPGNALCWLTPMAEDRRVYRRTNAQLLADQRCVVRNSGVAWVGNGLRHSFCSYRLALTGYAARTALEAGNSPAMIHRHYKALVTEAAAKKWFDIIR